MATGILGRALLDGVSNTVVYTVPSGKVASFTFNAVNLSSGDAARIYVALSDTGTPNANDYIEYGASIAPTGVLERTGIVAHQNVNLICKSSSNTVALVVYGYEETP